MPRVTQLRIRYAENPWGPAQPPTKGYRVVDDLGNVLSWGLTLEQAKVELENWRVALDLPSDLPESRHEPNADPRFTPD